MGDLIRLEHDTAPGVATIRLDRPKVNAINGQMLDELDEVCAELAADGNVRAAVLWGGPKVFGGGADIPPFLDFGPQEAAAFSARLNNVMLRLESLPQITVAAINGYALGGGLELAMATDFRVAAADALLGLPETQLGLFPGGGGTQRLPRLVGVTQAKEMIYRGDHISAERALEIGLVSAVHEPDSVYDRALELAAGYAAGAASILLAKAAITEGLHLPLHEAVKAETARFGEAFATDDVRIGLESFVENGPGRATFTGR